MQVELSALKDATQRISKAAGKGESVLAHISDHLRLEGGGLRIEIPGKAEAMDRSEPACVVLKALALVAKGLGSGAVNLHIREGLLSLSQGAYSVEFAQGTPNNVGLYRQPGEEVRQEGPEIRVRVSDLVRNLPLALANAGGDGIKPGLCGVWMYAVKGGLLRIAGSTGIRLLSIDVPYLGAETFAAFVPRAVMPAVVRLLSAGSVAKIRVTDRGTSISVGGRSEWWEAPLETRPHFEGVLDLPTSRCYRVGAEPLKRAIKAFKADAVRLSPMGQGIGVSWRGPVGRDIGAEVACEVFGEPSPFEINPKMLASLIGGSKGPVVLASESGFVSVDCDDGTRRILSLMRMDS